MKITKCHLHLIYLIILFAVVLGFMIVCFCKGQISDVAFQNVSFAATVSSIILAVISIVLSMNAANTTSNNLGSLSEVERKLSDSLFRLDNISKALERTEGKIDKLSIPENLQPSAKVEDSNKLSNASYSFFMHGTETNKSIAELETLAIDKITKDLELKDVERDVALKTDKRVVFDASANRAGITYLFEVKLCNSKGQALDQLRMLLNKFSEAFKDYKTEDLIVYIIFVCKENNKAEILNGFGSIPKPDNFQFAIVLYNKTELESEK